MRYQLTATTTEGSTTVYLGEAELLDAIAEWIASSERVSFYIEARP